MSTAIEPTECLACNACGTTVPKPEPLEYQPLWNTGWRWKGSPDERPRRFVPHTFIYSCPDCPPVI